MWFKKLWGSDFFHALGMIKRLDSNEITKRYIAGELHLNIIEKLKWGWVSGLRFRGVPYAYIFKKISFLDYSFYVDRRVLIPRVETEELVVMVVDKIKKYIRNHSPQKLRILDIGTGSGVIALSVGRKLLEELPTQLAKIKVVEIVGLDKSKKAIAVAKINQQKLFNKNYNQDYKIKLVYKFKVRDIFNSNVQKELAEKPFDFIISNPPYIANLPKKNTSKTSNTLNANYKATSEVIKHEPSLALWGGKDGLNFYRYFASHGSSWLNHEKWSRIILELGGDQGEAVKKLFLNYNFKLNFEKDLCGKVRYLEVEK